MSRITSRVSLAAIAAAALALSACGGSSSTDSTTAPESSAGGTVRLTVGASPVPHAEILNFVKDQGLAEAAGIDLKVVEYTDYVQPNVALSEGDLDANYFQHLPYLKAEIADKGYEFEHFEGVHIEPYGIYSQKIKNISELAEGAKVGISNDPSNQARALSLLVKEGVLKDLGKEDASIVDYDGNAEANPKKLQFVETEAPALPRVLPDVDIAIINGNFALEGGLKPAEDAIVLESVEGNPYANLVAYAKNTEKLDALKKLDEILHGQEVADFIKKTWPNGEVISSKN
ncbi:ABC transporter [Bowdeniella nasicola]|uniref:Lipoprotein n=1 Tax=Bowdeniella nasicola TaxID=208480 RepID=A0A1Q5Q284_9ACTO|nr:MetQ/NlpA family ABC transporter substrate-binding protein [Bowdeniella nasicola]OKL53963.1 ABC transporter [Bowdeniella nasicola]